MTINRETQLDCGHAPTTDDSGIGTGYGRDSTGAKHCYDCCATLERESMISTGRATLYLSDTIGVDTFASDWPGKLRFKTSTPKTGRHNMAGHRFDVWFRGPDGKTWHGVQYGSNTQTLHCRSTNA